MTKEEKIMVVGQEGQPEVYRGAPLPKGFAGKLPSYQRGFKAGVDALLDRCRLQPGELYYDGVPYPDGFVRRDDAFHNGWRAGVLDAHQNAWAEDTEPDPVIFGVPAGQDREVAVIPTTSGQDAGEPDKHALLKDLSHLAFGYVLAGQDTEAQAEVSKLSGPDRAVLDYWLGKLTEAVNEAGRYDRYR